MAVFDLQAMRIEVSSHRFKALVRNNRLKILEP